MKILLTALNSQYIHSNLAVRYLKKFTEDLDYECVVREFTINDREEHILEKIIEQKPDVVAFSVYIWNVEMIRRLSKLIKKVDQNIEILYGGPEVSFDSRKFLKENDGDYVIQGEGENTFREFVRYKKCELKIDEVRNLYYKVNDEVMENEKRPLMSMDDLKFPYDEDEDLSNKIIYYEASRGCPFNCKYCLSSTSHGVRFLSLDRVYKELDYFINKKVRLVKFVDRTFNCNKKFAMAIWKYLIEKDTNTQFHFEISGDILTDDEIELLKKAPKGRFRFEIGVQTTNNEVLNNINRFVNFDDIKEKVIELRKLTNIVQHLDLIAGLPGEDYNSFINSFNDVYKIKPDEVQLGFLKLLKGSSMREEADKYKMVFSPYPPYEILKTDVLSYDEVIKLKKVEKMVDKYYNSGKFKLILKYFEDKFETPFDFYYCLSTFFDKKGYFGRNLKNSGYYEVLLNFDKEILGNNDQILKEIAKYTYLLYNKRRGVPDFFSNDYTKDEKERIKNLIKDKIDIKDYYLAKFTINIDEFIESGQIVKDEEFYIFSNLHINDYINLSSLNVNKCLQD